MAVKIRLSRKGTRSKPFYHLVVIHSKNRRDGDLVEDLGWYNPISTPKQALLNTERVKYWVGIGAEVAEGAQSLLEAQGILGKSKIVGPKSREKRRKPDKLTKAEKRTQAQSMVEAGDKTEASQKAQSEKAKETPA